MILCPHCNTENRDEARFCRFCAVPLSPQPALEHVEASTVADESSPVPSADEGRATLQPQTPPLASAEAEAASIEQRVHAASQPAASEAAGDSHAAPEPLPTPLAVGTQLQDRYTILEIDEAGAARTVYRARDEMRCPDPNCHAENPIGEAFCQNCGRELTEHGTCLLEENSAPQDASAIAPPLFIVDGRVYTPREDIPPTAAPSKPFRSGVHLSCGAKSDVGLVRGASGDPNEDSVFAMAFSALYESVARPAVGLFIVADGIGGSEAGEIASKMCIQIVAPELMRQVVLPVLEGREIEDGAVRVHIQDSILDANARLLKEAEERKNDMGTTVTLALVVNDRAYVASVGDSRTYLFADGRLKPITRDHSLVASLVEQKMIAPEDIYTHPQRNVILRSLGAKPEPDVDLFPADGGALRLAPGSRLLLCCDGLWEMVRDDEMEEELWHESDPQKLCEKLVTRANQMGGDDNISVVILNVEE